MMIHPIFSIISVMNLKTGCSILYMCNLHKNRKMEEKGSFTIREVRAARLAELCRICSLFDQISGTMQRF